MEKKAKSETNKITFVFLFLLLIIYSSNAQQEEFIRGVFIHSGEGALTLYGNYDQVQLMGTNSVHQMVVREVPGLGQTDNFQQLSRFNYIYASNDSGTGSENCDWCNAEPENIDWISYFTQAKYMKWEAEGDSIFNGSVGIKHQGGEFYQEADGTKGWKTSDNNIGDTVIYGPNYWQYPRYTFTNPAWNPTPINYKVNFRMKIDFPSSESLPVCIIMVLMTKPSTGYSKILEIDTLTTDILNTAYQNFTLSYNYKDYIIFEGIANSSGIHPATITKPFSEIETNPSLNIGSEVQFIVKWLGNRQLFIDYIEVYDEKIWEYYFINRISQTKNAIRDYNLSFSSNPNLYEKLKYYVTIDEPHSIDCYIPIKRVQEIMDSLNIDKNLLVHWYPGWSHYRDGTNTWPLYYQLAKPKKINFWYAPFVSDENGNNTANDFTLYWFQRNLQQARLQQNDFFVTLQTFGWRDKQTNLSYGYRTPTPEEISAETMLALAHGIKGLFYEHYYSIRNMEFGGRYYIVDGLVDTLQNGVFPLTPRWNKVEAIFNRLKGALGKTLMNLNYNSSYLQLRRYIHEPTTESVNKHYLTLSEVSLEGFPKIDFHTGFLEDKNNNDNKFFLLTNQITVGNRLVELILTKPVAGFYNYRFRNVEPQYNLDTTYQNTFTTTLNFPAGEGYLYQVAPVVKYGGKLAYNDTIKSNTTLSDDMWINNKVNLVINRGKYYTIQDTVTLVGTGFITGPGYLNIAQGGEIKIASWSKSVFK